MVRRPRLAAAAALALLIAGQLVALAHEARTRHVTCAEHGEQLELTSGTSAKDDGCGQSHLLGADGDAGSTHEDCATARLLRTSARPSAALQLHVIASELAVVHGVASSAHVPALDVIALAPKTSPPV